MEQRTDEWHAARLGKVTASKIADIMAVGKNGKPLAGYENYMADLIAERLSGSPTAYFINAAMEWGTETEPQARAAYRFLEGQDVEEVGFIDHPTIGDSGASPDGLVGADGLVEIKCPNTKTHLETLISETVPAKYIKQMQWQMACTGRAWCDFVSFDPRLPDELHMFVRRVPRDDQMIGEMEEAVRAFLAAMFTKIEALKAKYSAKEAA